VGYQLLQYVQLIVTHNAAMGKSVQEPMGALAEVLHDVASIALSTDGGQYPLLAACSKCFAAFARGSAIDCVYVCSAWVRV
jgi:hypothetical protein